MSNEIKSTATFINEKLDVQAHRAIISGSGLSSLVDQLENPRELPYSDIPGFPVSTVTGHTGKLVTGTWDGTPVVLLQGRHHYYEGYSMQQVIFPTRVLHALGIRELYLTNAAGGLNLDFRVGDLMLINDHINLMGDHPLIGPNDDTLGPRFPDMSAVYDPELIHLAEQVTLPEARLFQGVYVSVSGPSYETPAEYRYLRIIGGDAVGMSTVPEAIAARHMGMKLMGLSVITDMGVGEDLPEVSHEEVQHIARQRVEDVARILRALVTRNA